MMRKSSAIDVQGLEDLDDRFDRDVKLMRPADDVEVFLSGFKPIENSIEKKCIVVELAFEQAEIASVKFYPETFALQMFQPAGPQIPPPMVLDPVANRRLPQVVSRFFTFYPLESEIGRASCRERVYVLV